MLFASVAVFQSCCANGRPRLPFPTNYRTCALDDSAAVSKIAVAGKVTEAPMKNLSIKPVAGRLVTASRPSIRWRHRRAASCGHTVAAGSVEGTSFPVLC